MGDHPKCQISVHTQTSFLALGIITKVVFFKGRSIS